MPSAQFYMPSHDAQPGPSPISIDRVEAYVQICSHILTLVIRNYRKGSNASPMTEAELVAAVSSAESVPAADVAAVLYYMIARNVLRRFWTGDKTFVLLSHVKGTDNDRVCGLAPGSVDACASAGSIGSAVLNLERSSIFQKTCHFRNF